MIELKIEQEEAITTKNAEYMEMAKQVNNEKKIILKDGYYKLVNRIDYLEEND